MLPRIILRILTLLTNEALCSGKLLPQYKLGVLTPVPKKGKDLSVPDSYRRITICSILGKVVEKEIAKQLREVVDPKQSSQQYGFTMGRSPTTCAFIITEAIAEARNKDETLYLAFLDVKKAFDTVSHIPMLLSLQQHMVTGNLWNILNDMYKGVRSQVKLHGRLSEEFPEKQGIRQGGLTSTDLYKVKSNQMLDLLSSHPLAYRIGTVCVGAPTTADDTTLITSSQTGVKVLMGIAEHDARIHQYSFSVQKTKLMIVNPKDSMPPEVKLNCQPVATTERERHLGIERVTSNSAKVTIDTRIKEARRALYSLAGAGLHGLNGVGPKVSIHMFNIYVYPILTYGLESLILDAEHYKTLESFYKSVLRKIQHLPESTATPAIYILLGCIPLQGLLHIKLLTFYVSILQNSESVECEIVKRQLAMKELSAESWVNQVRRVLSKYNLPSAYKLLLSPPEKSTWKSQVTKTVASHWLDELCLQAASMKTLSFVNLENIAYGCVAEVWMHSTDPVDARMATIKTRLLVQRYPLGYSYSAGAKRTLKCALCEGEVESVEHFLLVCPSLAKSRKRYLDKLTYLAAKHQVSMPNDNDGIVRFILTPALYVNSGVAPLIEQASRRLVYRLHCTRSSLLGHN